MVRDNHLILFARNAKFRSVSNRRLVRNRQTLFVCNASYFSCSSRIPTHSGKHSTSSTLRYCWSGRKPYQCIICLPTPDQPQTTQTSQCSGISDNSSVSLIILIVPSSNVLSLRLPISRSYAPSIELHAVHGIYNPIIFPVHRDWHLPASSSEICSYILHNYSLFF